MIAPQLRLTLRMLLLVTGVAMPLAPGDAWAQAAPPRPTVLGPGDLLRITVWRKPEFSGDFVIGADGSITHPLYRELRVGGLPPDTLEARVREFLTRYEAQPAFVLTALHRVVIGGEVRQPNVYTVPVGTTIAEAIALAGGTTERARVDRIQLRRADRDIIVNLKASADSLARTPLVSGDQLTVPRGSSFVRDVAAPTSSIVAALASLTAVIVQLSR